MILLTHIVIALSSAVLSTLSALWPSRAKLYGTAALIAATLATGTYLVISTHSSILSVCLTGLFYLGVVLSGVGVGVYRLAAEKISSTRP